MLTFTGVSFSPGVAAPVTHPGCKRGHGSFPQPLPPPLGARLPEATVREGWSHALLHPINVPRSAVAAQINIAPSTQPGAELSGSNYRVTKHLQHAELSRTSSPLKFIGRLGLCCCQTHSPLFKVLCPVLDYPSQAHWRVRECPPPARKRAQSQDTWTRALPPQDSPRQTHPRNSNDDLDRHVDGDNLSSKKLPH